MERVLSFYGYGPYKGKIGVDHTSIGLYTLVSFPYVIKVLWAPMVDAVKLPFCIG